MSKPANVFVIRHGEKPGDCKYDGPYDGPNLSAKGQTRAEAISIQQLFPVKIDFVFATKPSKHSHRPLQTILPFAKSANLIVNAKYEDDEYKLLVKKLMSKKKYHKKNIVICWHHGEIPELLKEFGLVFIMSPQVPINYGKWNPKVFDRLIHLDFTGKLTVISTPQKLLFGDSET